MSIAIRLQYRRLKQPFPDALLLFRLGDCYELYGEDARIAAHALGLSLSMRTFDADQRILMCPVPYRAADGHIRRLVALGYKVALAEQIGDLRTADGLVVREVVRIITPVPARVVDEFPPSTLRSVPTDTELHGRGVPPLSHARDSPTIPGMKKGDATATSTAGLCESGWPVASAVQLALFELPAQGCGSVR